MSIKRTKLRRVLVSSAALAVLAACSEPIDFDLRDIGNGFDTSNAAQNLGGKPRPDARGVISYPTYQVVAAQQDDTIRAIAIRLGLDSKELASYNGIGEDVVLRRDEIIALPTRVPEPVTAEPATIEPQPLDVASVATTALDRVEAAPVSTTALPSAAPAAAPTGPEPIRHQVVRGQTVYAISRLYNVPVSRIAEWNSLDSEFTVREGQFLLIPQSAAARPATVAQPVTQPGQGSQTPLPPSATAPLPDETPSAALPASATPEAPDLGNAAPASSNARFSRPLAGSVIRAYAPGRNEGIDIGAPAGSAVTAAGSGSVAAVTNNTDGVSIVVIKHDDGLLTVYTNIDSLSVAKGDTVTRGQPIGKVRPGDPSYLHFEVRRGLKSVDPADYLPS